MYEKEPDDSRPSDILCWENGVICVIFALSWRPSLNDFDLVAKIDTSE